MERRVEGYRALSLPTPDGPVNEPKGYRDWREGESSPKDDMGHLIYPISVQDTARSGIGLAKPLPTPSCRAYQCERGRLWYGCEGEQSTDDRPERRRRHRTRRTGKPSTGGRTSGDRRGSGLRTASCPMKFGPTRNGATANATNLTSPAVTLEAESQFPESRMR
jgi:hypothetical protein